MLFVSCFILSFSAVKFIKVSINLIARKELTLLNICLWSSFIMFNFRESAWCHGWILTLDSEIPSSNSRFTISGLKPCRMLAPQPGINPASLPLQGRFLTTEPSGKSHLLLSLPIKGTEEEEGLRDAWSLYWLTRFSEPRKENGKRWNVSVLWANVTSITKYRSVNCQLYYDHFSSLECGTVR